MTRVAYVTGGGVGAGHFARGVAIARALRRAGAGVELRMFSDRLPYRAPSAIRAWTEVPFEPQLLEGPEAARSSALGTALQAFAPDVLLVDFFWAHVRHLLPLPRCEAWLLLRWAPAAWLAGIDVLSYDPTIFARTIAIEPGILVAATDEIPPVVVTNPAELRPREALRERFDLRSDENLVLVAQAGQPGEADTLVSLAERCWPDARIVRQTLFDDDALFPIADWLAGADIIVGGAGYNLFWETRWLGLQGRTHLQAFPRTIDDQAWRLVLHHRTPMLTNGADSLARMLG